MAELKALQLTVDVPADPVAVFAAMTDWDRPARFLGHDYRHPLG